MEVQCPFSLSFEQTPANSTFADFLLAKCAKFGKSIALILILQMACAKLGIPCTAISPLGTVDELWHMVDLCEASHVFTESTVVPKFEDVRKKAMARGSLSKIRHIWLLEDYVSEPISKPESVKGSQATINRLSGGATRRSSSVMDLNNKKKPPPTSRQSSNLTPSRIPPTSSRPEPQRAISPASSTDDLEEAAADGKVVEKEKVTGFCNTFLLFFSSGTTGLPKPIEISHTSFIIQMQQLSASYLRPPKKSERVLASVALYHLYGTTTAYLALCCGATVVTAASNLPDLLCHIIAEFKIQCVYATPYNILTLAEEPLVEAVDLSSIQTLTCAGAPLDPLLAQQCAERLELKDLRQLYGASETMAVSLSFFGCTKIDSVGVPLSGTTCKVVHPDKRHTIAAGELGELCVKGPQMVTGSLNSPRYYKNPKATNELLDKDGYVKTGDLAYYDSEGYLYIVDKIKDMIKYKGMQASPTEVEILIRTHPGVADCAVIGRPEAISGDVPAAFVVKRAESQHLQPSDIRDHVKGKISGFKELKGGIFFVTEIPRSVSGKILRRQLKSFWERDRQAAKKGDPKVKGKK